MSELILSEQERAAGCLLMWDDAALGRLVRHLSYQLEDRFGDDGANTAMAAQVLVNFVAQQGHSEHTIDLGEITLHGEAKGRWSINISMTGF